MGAQSSGRDPVEKLAEEFAERYRRGERPSLTEYTARHPELADEICDLFPALVEMEQLASVEGPHTGPYTPVAVCVDRPRQLREHRILREISHWACRGSARTIACSASPWGRSCARCTARRRAGASGSNTSASTRTGGCWRRGL